MEFSNKYSQSEREGAPEDKGKISDRLIATEAQIKLIDAVVESPANRAYRILNELRNSTNPELIPLKDWDMICFSVEFLGLMHHTYPWLEPIAREAIRLVYLAHYHGYYSENNETVARDANSLREIYLQGDNRSAKDSD